MLVHITTDEDTDDTNDEEMVNVPHDVRQRGSMPACLINCRTTIRGFTSARPLVWPTLLLITGKKKKPLSCVIAS